MAWCKTGSYQMGPNDQDVTWAMTSEQKTVQVKGFWIDETEITNNQYRQFVEWVRDSIAYLKLGEVNEDYLLTQNEYEEDIDPPFINWDEPIEWDSKEEEVREALEPMFYTEKERFNRIKQLDVRKLNFVYYREDLRQAARKQYYNNNTENRTSFNYKNQKYDGQIIDYSDSKTKGEKIDIKDRSSFIMKETVNVYPDTLVWISDYTYSYNEGQVNYFWHPVYDNYPVVGVTWKQARAFAAWRSLYLNSLLTAAGEVTVQDFHIPTESEWEYASRGGQRSSMYPWGGYYITNPKGCYVANFKPLRGNYSADGGVYPVIVAHYEPNDFGIYDMAGNVSEWTRNAWNPAAYGYTDDLNPDYEYETLPGDAPERKRKVIRGGSWKDIGMYLQCSTRSYEYEDTAKSYIGFRCTRTYLGHSYDDQGTGSNIY